MISARTLSGTMREKLKSPPPYTFASRVTATLRRGSIVGGRRVRAKLRGHSSVKVRLVVRTVDVKLHRAKLRKTIRARR